ncbi:hypothetical protein ACFLW5_00925 [Chloroflexota bacterium]
MLVECPECGERKYFINHLQYGKKYRCRTCGELLVLPQPKNLPTAVKERSLVSIAQQAIAIVIVSVFFTTILGTSVAIASPERTLATPFRRIAATVMRTSGETTVIIDHVRGVVATYERSIVSESLQSMRVIEGLYDVPSVTTPTNDMASFPAAEYSLFPDYVESRFSQFKYTVDPNGTVNVHKSATTTDTLIRRIEFLLHDSPEVLR